MANLLSWNGGLNLQKKRNELITTTPLISSLRTMSVTPARTSSALNQTNRTTGTKSSSFSLANVAQQQNDLIRQQAEQRRQQEEQQRQQRIAEAQRQQEQRKQQEAQRKLQQQQAQQQKQRNLLASAGLGNSLFQSTDLRANLEAQKQARLKREQEAAAKKKADEEANPWKKYYEEEKQKVRDQAFKNDWGGSTLQDIFNAGWDRRLAETNARNRYNNELLNKAYDEEGNTRDEEALAQAKKFTQEASNVAKQYADYEHAKGKAIGATYDSDYKDNRFYATLNAIRSMDVGNAITGGAEGGLADATKFVLNLLPGMATAPIQGGGNIAEAISGKGLDSQTGEHRELTGLERLGRGASGAIDAAGVFFGGSGDLLNSVGNALFKKGATEVTKQALKNTTKEVVKGYIKAMLEEGAEEAVQQAFEFFGDGGRLVTEDGEFDADSFKQLLAESAQAGALGAVGGGIFHAGGQAIDAAKSNLNNRLVARNARANTNLNTNVNENNNIADIANANVNENNNIVENVNEETNIDPSRVKTTNDGTMVKQNADGTASRLSDAELANVITNNTQTKKTTGINPFETNSLDFSSSDEDINALTKRAAQGDESAKQKLAEMLQEGLQENQKTDWRGKSVDEVINPETDENVPVTQNNETNLNNNQEVNQNQDQANNQWLNGEQFNTLTPTEQRTYLEQHSNAPAYWLRNLDNTQLASVAREFDIDPTGMSPADMMRAIQEKVRNPGVEVNTPEDIDQSPEVLDNERAIAQDEKTEAQALLDELNRLWGPMEETTQVAPSYDEDLSLNKIYDVMDGKTTFDDYVGDQRELMWKSFKDSNRGTETFYHRDENGNIDGRNTVSDNGTLYRQLYQEYGGRPTKENFNDAFNDVLAKGKDSQYYDGFREFDHDGERSIFNFNQGNENIDMILDLKEDMAQRNATMAEQVAPEQNPSFTVEQEVATGTEPLSVAEDGTPEFVKRYTEQTTLEGVDNSQKARASRMKQFMDSLKKSDNPIVKKFYEIWHGDRKKSVVADLTSQEIRRYVSESGVPISNDAKVVMTGDFVRHLNKDGHLTGIWRNPDQNTGIQIDANPLTASDIAMLDDVVKNPDTITHTGRGRDGEKLKIEKQLGDNLRAIAEVVEDGKELKIISYYKTNKAPIDGALPTSGNSGLSNNSSAENSARTATLSQSIAENTENVTPTEAGRSYETESESLPEDFDVKHYVTDQVEAQQKRSKVPLKERIADATAELKHYLVDDAVAYERYIKDKNERLNLREGVDRVRSSDMIARQYMNDHGLGEIGKMSDADLNEFQQYLIAKRAQEVEAQGKKTGRSKAADQALIDSVGDKYAKQEAIIRQYTHDMLEYSAENGLISEKLKDKLIEENPNYVPMNRVFDVVEKKTGFKSKQLGNLNDQSVVQKMTGSERVVDNPIESLMSNTMRMINEAERNKVAKLISQSEAFHEKVLKDGEKPRAGYDKLSYMVDGETVSYEVPELVAREMKNLNNVLPKAADNILKVVGAPTRWLRSGATQNNPIFAASNLLRDQMQTLVTGNVTANLRGTKDALVATFSPGKRGKELRAELNRAGIIGNEYRQTYGYKSGDLMAQLQADNNIKKGAVERLKHPVDALGDLIGRTEYFTRAQQYFGTNGDATTKAQAARNNTLNFGRAGATTRILNRIIPFLNAGVQGGRITVNSFKNRPIHTTLAMASITGVALAAKGAAEAQNKELWDRIDESDKGQNIIIFTPDAHYNSESNRVEGIIKIPVAQMLYPLMDAANNMKGDASDATKLAGDIFTAVTGLEAPNEENGLLPVVNQLTPTAVKPFLEAAMNKSSYTGNDLVSEYDSNKAPEDKGAKYTTGLARTIAGITGIDAPVVDNFIQNWGGGLAKDLSKVMTDNPDNKSDGGGIGAMFENGFNRRFLSGTVESQYEIAEGLAKNYKNEVKNTDAFKNLTSEQQQKVLNAIDSDMNSIASLSAKVEQGRADENSSLTKRQTEIVANGFNAEDYIKAITDKNTVYNGSGTKGAGQTLTGNILDYGKRASRNNAIEANSSISNDSKSVLEKYNSMTSDDWNDYIYGTSAEAAAAEYKLALAKYENDLANDKLTEPQRIKREKELAKLAVSQKWTKDYRDAYSLAGTKADMQAFLNELDDATRAETVATLNGLNNAMYEAGIITASTYKTRANAINNTTSSKSSGSRKSSSSKKASDGISSAEASALASLAKTMVKNSTASEVKTPSAPTTNRKMTKRKSGGNSSGLKTYSSNLAKTVSVSGGAKRSIA
ncbi:hypothetical protein IJJ05_00400 [Candidatus Saccharibacteria bacterium]|nr:hypothetical protein [Candidatus Saccharibacteria bacterium]